MTTKQTHVVRLRRRDLLAATLAPMIAASAARAQSGAPGVRMRQVATPHFRIEMPDKDWRLLPGGINTLGSLAHKDGTAAIVIEHEMLQIALAPEEVDTTFAELESATIKERELTATGFTSRVTAGGSRRAIVDFQRRAPTGSEQVRVFVLVKGKHLYRLACVAPPNQFSRYAPIFEAVSASFTPLDAVA